MLFSIWTGLTMGNFVWAIIATQNWDAALERSFFQGVALFMVWLVNKMRK